MPTLTVRAHRTTSATLELDVDDRSPISTEDQILEYLRDLEPSILWEFDPNLHFEIVGTTPHSDDLCSSTPSLMENTVVDGIPMIVHNAASCQPPCTVHSPSDHLMKDFPRYWRNDRRLWERTCPHGVGHPDPDDLAFKRRVMTTEQYDNQAPGMHGCDGCCRPPEEK